MPELYDSVRRSNSKYIPQFIGSNFENLKSAADTLDTRYRQNKDLSDRLAIQMANDRYLEQDQHIGDTLHKNMSQTIDEVAKSDENFENSTGIIQNLVRDYSSDRNRIAALDNSKRYEQYLNAKDQLGSEGVDFTKAFKGTVNPDGTTNRFQGRVEKRLDYDKQKEQYFNQIEDNLINAGFTQDQINTEFLKSTTTGGISDPRIRKYADEAFKRHKTTAEYKQEKELIQHNDPSVSDIKADEMIKRSIISTGLERVHNLRKEDLERHSESFLNTQKSVNENPYGGTDVGSSVLNKFKKLSTSNDLAITDTEEVYTDKENNPIDLGSGAVARTYRKYQDNKGNWFKAPLVSDGKSYTIDKNLAKSIPNPNDPKIEGTAANQLDYINKSLGLTIPLKDYEDQYEQASNNMKILTPKVYNIEDNMRSKYDAELKSDIFRKPILIEGKEKSLRVNDKDFPLDKSKGLEVLSSKIVPNVGNENFKGGGMDITIISKATGESVNAIIPINNEFTKATEVLGDLSKNSINQGYDSPEYKKGKEIKIYGSKYPFVVKTVTAPKSFFGEQYQQGEGHPNQTIVKLGVKLPSGTVSYNKDDIDNPLLKALVSNPYSLDDFSDIYYEYLRTTPLKNVLGAGKAEASKDIKDNLN